MPKSKKYNRTARREAALQRRMKDVTLLERLGMGRSLRIAKEDVLNLQHKLNTFNN